MFRASLWHNAEIQLGQRLLQLRTLLYSYLACHSGKQALGRVSQFELDLDRY